MGHKTNSIQLKSFHFRADNELTLAAGSEKEMGNEEN